MTMSACGEALADQDIHVWCASLDDFHDVRCRCENALSADEHARARKFHFAHDRDRFMTSRWLLRELLGRCLLQAPATLAFAYGRFGKPTLARPEGQRPLYFNASHSGPLAIYAMTWTGPVGIDVERVRDIPDVDAIASRVFGPAHASTLLAVPPERRTEEFFARWTRHEAFVKATGEGIGTDRAACPPPEWQLQNVWPATGYIGAIAYRNDRAHLSMRTLTKESLCKSPSSEPDM
jgi:4'-phosphopantetheinyl transferase